MYIYKIGSGTTNDGNTARRFFKNAKTTTDITGLDLEIIKRFYVILRALASEYDINTDEFNTYAFKTAELFISLCPWYYMPATVHKILIHGADVIRSSLLPIGNH